MDEIPEGYEIYEHPEDAQVFLRKKRCHLITDLEEQFVKKHLDTLRCSRRYLVDRKDQYITIYESNCDTENLKGIFGDLLSNISTRTGITTDDARTAFVNIADRHYTAVLRLCLDDREKRTFTAERFCFRGPIDDWIYFAGPDEFKSMVKKSVAILGKDEFFISPYL